MRAGLVPSLGQHIQVEKTRTLSARRPQAYMADRQRDNGNTVCRNYDRNMQKGVEELEGVRRGFLEDGRDLYL